jgi:SAM-dependent methyltransferase
LAPVNAPDSRWRENVRRDWVAAAAHWQNQDPRFAIILDAMTSVIVEGARLGPGARVLDVASGPGSSAVALARAVGPSGHVVATDLLPEMLTLIEEQVAEERLENITIQLADAEALPFPDASFDAVTCHLGVVYFADVDCALREIRRVLKPGGKATFTTWGPENQNPYFSSLIEPFWDVTDVPPPDPSIPSIFRFGHRGALTARLEDTGFDRITEDLRIVHLPFNGTAEEYIDFVRGRSPTYERLAARVTSEQRAQVDAAIIRRIGQYASGGEIRVPAAVVVASGRRRRR